MMQIWAATCLASLHLATQQPETARRYADEAVEIASKFGFNGFGVAALRVRGLVNSMGDNSGARDSGLSSAFELASRLGMRVELAHCHAAMVVARIGDSGFHFKAAQAIFQEEGMTEWFEYILTMSAPQRLGYC
jgi:hypothetical protein